jgi:putative transposase
MILSSYGNIVQECWLDLPNHYPNLHLDSFVVMPNHIHGIFAIKYVDDNATVETGLKPVSTKVKRHGLSEFVRAFKTFSSRRINELRQTPGMRVWQLRFHDHIIRDRSSMTKIQEYILNNPTKWEVDTENL